MVGMMSCLCFFAAGIATGLITATLTALEDEFGIKPTLLAVIVVMYDCSYIVTSLPVAQKCKDMPKAIGFGMIIFIGGAIFFSFGKHLSMFVIGQIIMGIGATPLWVLSFVHIDDNMYGDKLKASKFTGAMLGPVPVGVVLGLGLAGLFLSNCSDTSDSCGNSRLRLRQDFATFPNGTTYETNSYYYLLPPEELDCDRWPVGFWILSGLAVPFAIWVFLSKKKFDDYKPERDAYKADSISRAETSEHIGNDLMSLVPALKGLITNHELTFLLLSQGAMSFVGSGVIAFAPRFFEKTLCHSKSTSSYLTAVFIPFIVTAYVVGGKILDKYQMTVIQQWKLIIGLQVAAIPFFFSFFMESTGGFIALMIVPCVALFLPAVAILNIAKTIVPSHLRAHSMALLNIASRLVGAIPGPIVLGALLDSDVIGDRTCYVVVGCCGCTLSTIFACLGCYSHIPENAPPPSAAPEQEQTFPAESVSVPVDVNQQHLPDT